MLKEGATAMRYRQLQPVDMTQLCGCFLRKELTSMLKEGSTVMHYRQLQSVDVTQLCGCLLENRASVNDEQKTSLPLLLKGRSEIKRDESGTIQLLLEQSKKHDMAISAAETAEINITNYRSSAADSKCDVDTDKWVQTYSNHDEARAATHGSLKAASTESLSSTSSQILLNPPIPNHSAVISSLASEETESSRSDNSVPEFSNEMLSLSQTAGMEKEHCCLKMIKTGYF